MQLLHLHSNGINEQKNSITLIITLIISLAPQWRNQAEIFNRIEYEGGQRSIDKKLETNHYSISSKSKYTN